VILFSFAAGDGLAEHVAAFDAMIQIITGTALFTVGVESVVVKPGTWIHMVAKTPHSIEAEATVVMLLTLFK
jgi:quercetin dioxygenase-like cupin family protein